MATGSAHDAASAHHRFPTVAKPVPDEQLGNSGMLMVLISCHIAGALGMHIALDCHTARAISHP